MNTQDLREWLGERLDRIEERMDRMVDAQTTMGNTQSKQAADIEHHIRRTDMLEKWVETVATDMHPIKEHVAKLRGIGWFIGAVAAVISFVVGVWRAVRG